MCDCEFYSCVCVPVNVVCLCVESEHNETQIFGYTHGSGGGHLNVWVHPKVTETALNTLFSLVVVSLCIIS